MFHPISHMVSEGLKRTGRNFSLLALVKEKEKTYYALPGKECLPPSCFGIDMCGCG
jgi:hypothetical protein